MPKKQKNFLKEEIFENLIKRKIFSTKESTILLEN